MNTGPNPEEADPLGQWPMAVDPKWIISLPSIRRALSVFSIHHREGTSCLNLCIITDGLTALKFNKAKDILLTEK
ncbi:MAG: hypothetical protein WA915_12740 [Candidatus Aminicenantaceae bacterium]